MHGLFDVLFEKPDVRKMRQEIQQTPFFQTLSDTEMKKVLRYLQIRSFQKGQRVFYEGDPGAALFIILRGKVQITRQSKTKRLVLGTLSKGHFFGELALVHDVPRTASANVSEDAVLVCLFKHDFENIIKHDPVLGTKLLKIINQILSQRLSAMIERYLNA